jgi:hypothetical protein
VTKKAAPIKGEPSDAATGPLAAMGAQDIAKFEAWLATKKGPIATAARDDDKRLLENAWKPELQSALKNEVYDAEELRGKIEASILKLTQIELHPVPKTPS